jgi:hypothetical protein
VGGAWASVGVEGTRMGWRDLRSRFAFFVWDDKIVYKTPLYDIIFAILWQSERLARLSVDFPLHAGLFISCCFSTKRPISGVSIETVNPFYLFMTEIKPQLLTFRNHRVTVTKSKGQQNGKKMSDRETHAR